MNKKLLTFIFFGFAISQFEFNTAEAKSTVIKKIFKKKQKNETTEKNIDEKEILKISASAIINQIKIIDKALAYNLEDSDLSKIGSRKKNPASIKNFILKFRDNYADEILNCIKSYNYQLMKYSKTKSIALNEILDKKQLKLLEAFKILYPKDNKSFIKTRVQQNDINKFIASDEKNQSISIQKKKQLRIYKIVKSNIKDLKETSNNIGKYTKKLLQVKNQSTKKQIITKIYSNIKDIFKVILIYTTLKDYHYEFNISDEDLDGLLNNQESEQSAESIKEILNNDPELLAEFKNLEQDIANDKAEEKNSSPEKKDKVAKNSEAKNINHIDSKESDKTELEKALKSRREKIERNELYDFSMSENEKK